MNDASLKAVLLSVPLAFIMGLAALLHTTMFLTIPAAEPPTAQDPQHRNLDLKLRLLELTNVQRTKAGLLPLRLGASPAPQLHAEAALDGCYNSHWDRWGLRPAHRHVLTGGTGHTLENVIGLNHCVTPADGYALLKPMDQEVESALLAWMESPGHRDAVLNPAVNTLHLGIAHDSHNLRIVQHFEARYVNYRETPAVDHNGTLKASANVTGATIPDGPFPFIQIGYEPPPQPLARGQLARTSAVCIPAHVASIRPPGPHTSSYRYVTYEASTPACIDPAATDPQAPAPTSPTDSNRIWSMTKKAVQSMLPTNSKVHNIVADHLETSTSSFTLSADISSLLDRHGPGIYSVTILGQPHHTDGPAILSTYPIFWQTAPPPGNPYSQPSIPVEKTSQ